MKIEELYRKDGKLNSAIIRQPWFLETELYKNIINVSNSLGATIDSSFSERVFLFRTRNPIPKCVICNKDSAFYPKIPEYSNNCGSRSCASKCGAPKATKTKIDKYGAGNSPKAIEAARSRVNQLNIKGRDTLKRKYNVGNAGQLPGHMDKVQKTLIKKYGVDHPSKLNHVLDSRYDTSLEFYSSLVTSNLIQVLEVKNPTEYKSNAYRTPCREIKFNCNLHGEESLPNETFKWRSKRVGSPCSDCIRPYNKSVGIAQSEIASYIEELGFKPKLNDRTKIHPREIDILVGDFGIEYHGLYWHSFNSNESKEERNYHLSKLNDSNSVGIKLIQVFEDEWIYKKDIVKSIIKLNLNSIDNKIYARKCTIDHDVSLKESVDFLEQNHLQGNTYGAKYKIGLRYNGELVSLITIGNSRFEKGKLELLRSSTKLNTIVVGGFSKLIKASLKIGFNELHTYADLRYFSGKSYELVGFKHIHDTAPGFYYTDKDRRYNRMGFQKHKLKDKLNTYDQNLTASINIFNNGYRRIWDCGQRKFILKT